MAGWLTRRLVSFHRLIGKERELQFKWKESFFFFFFFFSLDSSLDSSCDSFDGHVAQGHATTRKHEVTPPLKSGERLFQFAPRRHFYLFLFSFLFFLLFFFFFFFSFPFLLLSIEGIPFKREIRTTWIIKTRCHQVKGEHLSIESDFPTTTITILFSLIFSFFLQACSFFSFLQLEQLRELYWRPWREFPWESELERGLFQQRHKWSWAFP